MLTNACLRSRLGWRPDIPDIRDYNINNVSELLKKTSVDFSKEQSGLPNKVDLTAYCSPVEDQGNLGSCTANAAAAVMEYCENRAAGQPGRAIDASRLFIYKNSRSLAGITGDGGSYIRTTVAAMRLFGAPPEEYYPYDIEKFDDEPNAFCYAFAQNYRSMSYFRFPEDDRQKLLFVIKLFLASNLPSIFGFPVFSSISQMSKNGVIPFPSNTDKAMGGHAVAAFGYDDNIDTSYSIGSNTYKGKGAILIKNSWGTTWGLNGYGYLPYDYILQGLAIDWWSILKQEWVDTAQFK